MAVIHMDGYGGISSFIVSSGNSGVTTSYSQRVAFPPFCQMQNNFFYPPQHQIVHDFMPVAGLPVFEVRTFQRQVSPRGRQIGCRKNSMPQLPMACFAVAVDTPTDYWTGAPNARDAHWLHIGCFVPCPTPLGPRLAVSNMITAMLATRILNSKPGPFVIQLWDNNK